MRPTPEIALALITVLEMVRHVVDAAHGAGLVGQPQFAILMRLARLKLSLGVGRIELISMMRWIISVVRAVAPAITLPSSAYAGVKKMRITKRALSNSNFKRNVLACVLCTALLSACATHGRPETYAEPFGFFSGIWHGLIAGITITINIISWFLHLFGVEFLRDVQIIGRPNTGFGYYVGFIIGFFSCSGSARR